MPLVTRDNFEKRVLNLLRDYEEMLLAVHSKTRQASLENMLSGQAVMSLGVYWEAFTHDLFVAYVEKNSTTCINDFKRRLDKSLADKFNVPSTWITISVPTALSKVHAERLIDPKGWNVSATSAEDLRSKANQILHSTDALNFSLTKENAAFLDLLVATRNFLAHRSVNSRTLFKSALKAISLAGLNAELASSQVIDIEKYLKQPAASGGRRVHVIGRRLVSIAKVLVP